MGVNGRISAHAAGSGLSSAAQAAKHPIVLNKPAPDFFSGALLGNGGMGVVVTTRPDAVLLHVAHNNVWDQRIAELNFEDVGTFEQVFSRLQALPADIESLVQDEWYRDYCLKLKESYNKPYPRPMPCGTVLFGFDRRKAELLGHQIHIDSGLCEVFFLVDGRRAALHIFVDSERDQVWLQFVDEDGAACASPFNRAKLMPDPSTPSDIPQPECRADVDSRTMSLRQILPYCEPPYAAHPRDRAFLLTLQLAGEITPYAAHNLTRNGIVKTHLDDYMAESREAVAEMKLSEGDAFLAVVDLQEGLHQQVRQHVVPEANLQHDQFRQRKEATRLHYGQFWERSGVSIEDECLERVWYRNLYFFQCGVKEGTTCPGLFANWMYGKIGSAWHGDYHLDYNTQQPFWAAFSSNHADRHLPYVEMVHHITPVSKQWAEDYYGLRGAFYPVSAYPVDMSINPNAGPPFGWVMCTTPWVVQSLWWHYVYTMDKEYLRHKGFEPIRLAVLFMTDYMKRPEARGEEWGDDKFHIFPTVPPELYGLMPGFRLNFDSLTDLALTRFVMRAYLQACEVLGCEQEEASLIEEVKEILEHLPEYPTAESERGTVFVSVKGESPEMVYNTPNSAFAVFPAEDIGLHSPEDLYTIACQSYRNHRNEGGNELVFYHMQGARLGILDLEKFKRQIEYCMMPNGACTDMVLQTGGRYEDTLAFDFMSRMGVWFENTGLPAVINECLMQSYNGIIRLFPNWPKERYAEFKTLRAAGGFLVSAACEQGSVQWIEVTSEAGGRLRIAAPWRAGAVCIRQDVESTHDGDIELHTEPGETLVFVPHEKNGRQGHADH